MVVRQSITDAARVEPDRARGQRLVQRLLQFCTMKGHQVGFGLQLFSDDRRSFDECATVSERYDTGFRCLTDRAHVFAYAQLVEAVQRIVPERDARSDFR